MSRFGDRLARAEARVNRAFAEDAPVVFMIGDELRPVIAIFEKPDASVEVHGGGEIRDVAPALSVYTADIRGLAKRHAVIVGADRYWVTHIGADEMGRTRITLAVGDPGKPAAEIKQWSQ